MKTVAVILAYFACGLIELNAIGQSFSFSAVKEIFSTDADVLHKAQTMAFTTLALSELFHMLGMSNLERSAINVFKNNNKMMYLAFIAGVALQLIVITVPGVNDVFSTAWLTGAEWLVTALLSLIPIIAHEIIVLTKKTRKN